ncbi:Hypothetical protein FKW44_006672 [Caligus rogercresseyi]|uniref:Uncharacterized protein n=1 Tax=Caligus rogercresseyi TaxID=217165 RepID=A0A7T8KDM3_CALRO|nr:Hypothetical protein FKW44_006672 [Caligus rogercresseyi]
MICYAKLACLNLRGRSSMLSKNSLVIFKEYSARTQQGAASDLEDLPHRVVWTHETWQRSARTRGTSV